MFVTPTRRLNFVRTAIRLGRLLRLCLFVLYIVSPIDLLPEAVLGAIGLVDDLLVVVLLLVVLAGVYRATLHAQGQRRR